MRFLIEFIIYFFVIQSCNFHSICVVLCLIGCSSSLLCVRRRVHWTINVQCIAMSLCCDMENKKLPIIDLLRLNHTMFSEESGEIALSALAASQPLSTRANIEQTRQY